MKIPWNTEKIDFFELSLVITMMTTATRGKQMQKAAL